MPTKNDIGVTIETFQIIGDDTLRVDLSFIGTVEQDGKELTLNHERETVYVRKNRGFRYDDKVYRQSRDPRRVKRI